MARKTRRKTTQAAQADPEKRIIEAALALAARKGWARTGLADIAAEAKMPLHEAYSYCRSKSAILDALSRRIDREVLAQAAGNETEPLRDRLFDNLMHRFDALQPHREGIRAILRDSIGDPAALFALPSLVQSMTWMLAASGVSTAGLRGRLRTRLLVALYLWVLRVFLEDETTDLTRTMAALDQRLRRAESLLGLRGGSRIETGAEAG